MKKLILFFLCLYTISANAQWTQMSKFYLSDVFFTNADVGWAVGGNNYGNEGSLILKTTDGGTTWFSQLVPANRWLTNCYFIDTSTGWVCGLGGIILKTTNGGNDWFQQQSPVSSSCDFDEIYFINADTGWVTTNYCSSVLRTTNGGADWVEYSTGLYNDLNSISFINANLGWVCGSNGGIAQTTDGGITWSSQATPTTMVLSSIFFFDSQTGWSVGGTYDSNSVILKTTNGGTTWFEQDSAGRRNHLSNVRFLDANNGWAVGGNGAIIKTTDGGTTWASEGTGINKSFNSLNFYKISDCNYFGWIVGVDLIVLKATIVLSCTGVNEGESLPNHFKVSQNYPNPFNPSTTIEYQIVKQGNVEISIYDIDGRLVKSLLNTTQHAGSYTIQWNGQNDNGSVVSSGTYFYQVKSNGVQLVKKMLLLK